MQLTLPPLFAFSGSCPIPEEGQEPVPCQVMVLQTAPESPETLANYEAIQYLSMRSIEICAPLYLSLFAIGAFRRYIIGRI